MGKKNINTRKTSTGRQLPENMSIVVSRSTVAFPGVPIPFNIEDEDQLKEFQNAMNLELPVVVAPVADPGLPDGVSNVSRFGVVVKVLKILDLPDGSKNAFLTGEDRVEVFPEFQIGKSTFLGKIISSPDVLPSPMRLRFGMLMELVESNYDFVKNYFQELASVQMAAPRELQKEPEIYLNFIIVTSPVSYEDKIKLLSLSQICERAEATLISLDKIKRQIELRKEIYSKAASEIEREQRDHFLRTQIRTLQNEIGEGEDSDIQALYDRAERMNWQPEMDVFFAKEMAKLKRFNPNSPDYAIQYTYLETLLNLPWNNLAQGDIDLDKLEKDLDRDHYGLEKIKERILEHMAVLKLRGDMRSPILCLYGPPGVGKTSLCKSIADSIERDYARISLGGLHDETQIRGHRRTYIGALPGRIITALSKTKTNNPVFVLDEIDKIGNDHRGDPAQALLEVLDPEQNVRFHDNYLDVDYDLSKIFFIATANDISTISAPLRDRMELIDVSGYLPEEKLEIAKRHLIPKVLVNHGFKKNEIKFSDDAINTVIDSYTRESGVRKLEKTLAKLLRKLAVQKAKGQKYKKTLKRSDIKALLGKPEVTPATYESNLPAGVSTGLAWTPAGGEILFFETSLSKGKGVLTQTGNLGDVMKESAMIAYQWVKSNAGSLGIDAEKFSSTDVHLHVPEGAVPKDGPSAGITMVCSIASAFSGKRMRERVAMTGEMTLRGKVMPVGGIKEKILAAKRAGITDIILSEQNRKDIEDISPCYLDGLSFHYVDNVNEVLSIALEE